jgi:hypothetical protein
MAPKMKARTEGPAPDVMPKAATLGVAESSDTVVLKPAPLALSQLRKK